MSWCKGLRVVVIEPSAAGNVGWIARGMANFGAEELVLVNPAPFDRALAREFSCHGGFIIDGMTSAASIRQDGRRWCVADHLGPLLQAGLGPRTTAGQAACE